MKGPFDWAREIISEHCLEHFCGKPGNYCRYWAAWPSVLVLFCFIFAMVFFFSGKFCSSLCMYFEFLNFRTKKGICPWIHIWLLSQPNGRLSSTQLRCDMSKACTHTSACEKRLKKQNEPCSTLHWTKWRIFSSDRYPCAERGEIFAKDIPKVCPSH